MEKKLTKKAMFGMLLDLLEKAEVAEKAELQDFVAHEIDLTDKKAEKAKGYKRKKADDVLRDAVAECLVVDDFKVTADIVAELADKYDDVTAAKVTARLSALVKDGVAVKEEVRVDKRKLMGYKLA